MASQRARSLRKNLTDTEHFVWQRIRYRQLGGCKFRRQVPLGPYVADFVCLEKRLIVELDGGQHAEQVEQDRQRTDWLTSQRFTVLRFWNNEALENWDGVQQVIWSHLQADPPP